MPIKIPDGLPAAETLRSENIFVMTESRAAHQDIRPLSVLILNLMPKKIETETQLMRKLSNTPLQVSIDLLRIDDHVSKNTPKAHIDTFYESFDEVRDRYYAGMIITGAPLGTVPFAQVKYWKTFVEIAEWSKSHVTCTMFLCWAAQAALNVFYDMPKRTLAEKLSGVYWHNRAHSNDPLIRGFDDIFLAPHSHFASFQTEDILRESDLHILASSDEVGMYLGVSPDRKQVYLTGHPEYDAETLHNEYRRDIRAGLNPKMPKNYYINDDPRTPPHCTWRSHGHLLYANWLNYYVYQNTPFVLGAKES